MTAEKTNSRPEDCSVVPSVKGWCPGLYAPMQAKDGWLVRIRPTFGQISAEQALCIAQEAAQHGNGVITLTNRANLQLRGFSKGEAERFPARMLAVGLGLPDARQERRQTIQVSPLVGLDATCAADTLLCAQIFKEKLLAADALDALPDKFGFVVDGGGYFPVGCLRGDIALQANAGHWRVLCGVACSSSLSAEKAAQLALALALAFTRLKGAMRPLRKPEIGPILFERCGAAYMITERYKQERPAAVGALAPRVYGLGVPLGQLTPAMLRACALAARQGEGWLRLTPWHSLVLAGQQQQPMPEGFVTDPSDARLRLYACSGVKGCAQARSDAPAQAMALAETLPEGADLHVSGCSKGCAHPAPAALTVVAGLQQYALVRNGQAGHDPTCYVPDFEGVQNYVKTWAADEVVQK